VNLGQFFGLVGTASNIVGDNTSVYTEIIFNADFPQFTQKTTESDTETSETVTTYVSLVPPFILQQFIVMANAAIQEQRWFEKWRWAMGLHIAHYVTLYLRMYSDGSPTTQAAADSGALIGIVSSASLGDASVSYDTRALVAATEKWGAWNSTSYGQLLVTEARLMAMGGAYII